MPDYVHSVGTGLGEQCDLVHVPYDRRSVTGQRVAAFIDETMRLEAMHAGDRVFQKLFCPGCAMAVVVNALIRLAKDNRWDFAFIRDHMNAALDDLVKYGSTAADRGTLADAFNDPGFGKARTPDGATLAAILPEAPNASPYQKYLDEYYLGYVPGMAGPLDPGQFYALPGHRDGRRQPEAVKPPVTVDYTAPTAQEAVRRMPAHERSHRYDHD